MNVSRTPLITGHGATEGSLSSYATGFALSLGLTFSAYLMVVNRLASGSALTAAIFFLALVQLVVQLVFFLHLDKGSKSRWNLIVLLMAAIIVIILVAGSLWIMKNLDYNMSADTMNGVMLDQAE